MLNIEKRQYLLYNLTNKDVKGTAVNWTSIEFRKKMSKRNKYQGWKFKMKTEWSQIKNTSLGLISNMILWFNMQNFFSKKGGCPIFHLSSEGHGPVEIGAGF